MSIKYFLVAIILLALAACGGGSNTTPQSPSGVQNATRPMGNVTFSITIPPPASTSGQARRPMYVSPNTESVVIQQLDTTSNHNPVGSPEIVNVTANSAGCTTGSNGVTCSITFPAPAGTFDFSVKTYSSTGGNGSLLSENTLTSFTVIAGVANTISVTLNGVIASVTLPSTISGTVSSPQTLNFSAQDAGGSTIIGPGTYDNGPLTISATGVTVTPSSFSGPGSGTSASLQCGTAGSFTVQVSDAQKALGSVTYSCTAGSISLAPGSLSFDTVATSSSSPTYDQDVTATDPNPSPAFTWNLTCSPSGTASVNATGSNTIEAVRPLTPGTCTLSASDQYGAQSQTINIEVHTTTISIQSRSRSSH